MNPDLRIAQDPSELARSAAVEFAKHVSNAVHTKGVFTVALSGGSTPKSMYSLLANDESWRASLPWTKMHFFWGDERPVPPDDPESNYGLAYQAMLSKVPVPAANMHRIRGEEPDPAQAAQDYEQELQTFFQPTAGQSPRFDLVLLGLGSDGHTASLFPDTLALREREHLVIANWIEQLNTWRLTLTLPVFNNAASVMFLVSGAEKANILRAVLEEGCETYPAQLIRPPNGSMTWLVDRNAAAALLSTAPQRH